MCEVVTAHISWEHVESESVSRSFVSDSLQPHGLGPARFLCQWNSPGKNTGVGCHSFLQGIFPTQESNLNLPYYRQILYCLSHQGSPGPRWGGPQCHVEVRCYSMVTEW